MLLVSWLQHLRKKEGIKQHLTNILYTSYRYYYNHCSLALGNPNCLQTTRAFLLSQKSSHTVPQVLLKHTSTRPSSSVRPPTSLTVPSTHSVLESIPGSSFILVRVVEWEKTTYTNSTIDQGCFWSLAVPSNFCSHSASDQKLEEEEWGYTLGTFKQG